MNKHFRVFVLAIFMAALIGGAFASPGRAQDVTPPTPAVTTDLRLLPRPIYQPNLTLPGAAALIVPDMPTADEMKAALIVAAGFGRMSNGGLALSFLTASQFTGTDWGEYDLIFVGKPSAFPKLAQADLPIPYSETGYAAPEMQPEDGILQMAVSPWDDGRVVLVVGGNTDAGVVKAAQALSVSRVQTGADPSLAIVAGVSASSSTLASGVVVAPAADRTFGDLGYERKFVTERHGRVEFHFDIPPGYAAGEDPYLDLVFGNSTLLNYGGSLLEVYLNGHFIGSSRFSDGTVKTGALRASIRPGFFVTGINAITILLDLEPLPDAASGSFVGAHIDPESLLHIPLEPTTISTSDLKNLHNYPYPFDNDPTLAGMAFILPLQDLTAWEAAVRLAFHLGRGAEEPPYDLAVAYDGQIPEGTRRSRNLIVVGLPTELALIAELHDALPAPFEAGSNDAVLENLPVVYRLPQGVELGYLELLDSPWNRAHSILAVLGSSPGGVRQAVDALLLSALRNEMDGDFALVNGATVSSMDTRGRQLVESVASGAVPTPTLAAAASAIAPTRPAGASALDRDWVPVVVIGLIVLMAIILVIALVSGLSRRKG
jgi:hypothetical protein